MWGGDLEWEQRVLTLQEFKQQWLGEVAPHWASLQGSGRSWLSSGPGLPESLHCRDRSWKLLE